MKVNQFRLATAEDGVKTQDFVDGAPLSPNEIQDELSHFILEIENAHLQRTRHLLKNIKINSLLILQQVLIIITLQEDCYHVLTMLKIAKSLCDIYPLLNRSLLYSAIILHDIGKVRELWTSCNNVYGRR